MFPLYPTRSSYWLFGYYLSIGYFLFDFLDGRTPGLQDSQLPERPTNPTTTNTTGQNFQTIAGKTPILIAITIAPTKINVSGQKSL
ncbi:MAG: hypothetical protein AAB612_02195 [Patescibacteria group bacterium]